METSSTRTSSTSTSVVSTSSVVGFSDATVASFAFPLILPAFDARGVAAWKTAPMAVSLVRAPEPTEAPVPQGVAIVLDESTTFHDHHFISGGAPWRMLRLRGEGVDIARRWIAGGVVGPGEERLARTLVNQGFAHPTFAGEVDLDLVTVVIPAFEDVTNLAALLARLAPLRVIVVDDASANATEIARLAVEHGATYLGRATNGGPAAARNDGIAAAVTPYVWCIDDDVRFRDPVAVLTPLLRALRDPLVAAVAPRVVGAAGPRSRDRFEQHASPLDMGPASGLVIAGSAIPYVPSACLLLRRAALGAGFDATMRVGEDVDLVWRLSDLGWLVRYDASVVVEHPARATWPRWLRQRFNYGQSSAILAQTHGRRLSPFRVDAWTLLAWLSVLVGRPLIGLRITQAARNHLATKFADADNPTEVANDIVKKGMVLAAPQLARAITRTFGLLLLVSALHPRLRRRALGLFALGTLWRWRGKSFDPRDVALGVADDLTYGAGVLAGSIQQRSWRALRPDITKPTMSLREALTAKSLRT